jgi:hypothetical protein
MPGGGMKADEWEDPSTCIIREFEAEGSLQAAQAIELPEFEEHKLIRTPVDRVTRRPIGKPRIEFFTKGQRPACPFDPKNEDLKENPIHLFKVKPVWEGSALQRILRQIKTEVLASGRATQEELDYSGIGVWLGHLDEENRRVKYMLQEGRLTTERVDQLNQMRGLPSQRTLAGMKTEEIDEICKKKGLLTKQETEALDIEEIDEIDAIWLYPYAFLAEEFRLMKLGSDEPSEFYYHHLRRVSEVVRAGVFPELLSE